MSVFLLKVTEQIHLSPLVSFSSTYFYSLETGLSHTRRVCKRRAHLAPSAGAGTGPEQDSDSNRGKALGVGTPLPPPPLFLQTPTSCKEPCLPQLQDTWARNSTHAFLKECLCLRVCDFIFSLFFLKKLWPSFISVYKIKKHSSKKWLV